jgi:hypothetical protein
MLSRLVQVSTLKLLCRSAVIAEVSQLVEALRI